MYVGISAVKTCKNKSFDSSQPIENSCPCTIAQVRSTPNLLKKKIKIKYVLKMTKIRTAKRPASGHNLSLDLVLNSSKNEMDFVGGENDTKFHQINFKVVSS